MTTEPVFDFNEVVDRFDGDVQFVSDLVTEFFATQGDRVAVVQDAIVRNCANEVAEAIHALRSSLLGLGARRAAALAFELEKAGQKSELSSAPAILDGVKQEIAEFYVEAVRAGVLQK